MSDAVYLTLMLGAFGIMVLILVPTMFFARCKGCGAFNGLDALHCRKCEREMPR